MNANNSNTDNKNTDFADKRYKEPRRLILTADDFGASENINEGIRKGVKTGLIKTVAAIVTFPGAIEAITDLHKRFPKIGIGLHLSISSGYPLSEAQAVPSLINDTEPCPENSFYPIDYLIPRLESIKLDELETEIRQQIEALFNQGIHVDNLSSQHNILSLYSPFFSIVLNLAKEYDIPLRSSIPISVASDRFSNAMTRQRGLKILQALLGKNILSAIKFRKYTTLEEMRRNQRKMDDANIRHPDYLIDAFYGDPNPHNLYHILTNLPEGTSELVFHLGVNDRHYSLPCGIDADYFLMREFELFCLCSSELKRWLDLLNIERISFQDL